MNMVDQPVVSHGQPDDRCGRAALAGLLLAALLAPSVQAAPLVLAPDQLDQVTAAGTPVGVDVTIDATATGPLAWTYANTFTSLFNNPYLTIAFGIGIGQAYACCGPSADADVAASATGTGGEGRKGGFTMTQDDGVLAVGVATRWVVQTNPHAMAPAVDPSRYLPSDLPAAASPAQP